MVPASEGPEDLVYPLVPTGRIVEDPDVIRQFETPERGDRGRARFVVEPGAVDEVSAVAAWAFDRRARLIIQGANTGLVGASVPDPTGDQGVLRLQRLDRIVDFSPNDRVVIVEGGIRLSVLNHALASEGQFFPIELGSDPSVGGLVATNAGGARTIRYGTAGSRVVGLEAVIADPIGSVLGSVSLVGKDSSRLNVSRLFVGSFGALGVITRIALRLARTPTRVATAFVGMRSRHHVGACLMAFEGRFGEHLSAFELISGKAMRVAASNLPGLKPPLGLEHAEYVLVELSGHDDTDLEHEMAELLDQLAGVEGPVVDAVIGPPADLWGVRHSLSEGVRGAGATVRFDVAVPRTALPTLHDRIEREFSGDVERPLVTEFGHWAEGGTHLQLVYTSGTLPDDLHAVRSRVYSIVVEEFGGTFSAEHGLGPYNAEFYRRFTSPGEQEMERRVKEVFDPRWVFGADPFVEIPG